MSGPAFGYRLADVFAQRPYQGNGVAVFLDAPSMLTEELQTVTVEVRQFESAFLWSTAEPSVFDTRIFVVDRELEFAGHPVLGAGSVLHERLLSSLRTATEAERLQPRTWTLRLGGRNVSVTSRAAGVDAFDVSMDQGAPAFGDPMPPAYRARVAHALSLEPADLHADLPIQWASTGLKYLIIPVRGDALARTRIATGSFGDLLAEAGAMLAYVLDPDAREGRNWVNDGSVEDIATGSASGPAAAYLVRHRRADPSTPINLHQGRFLGRPSTMTVDVEGESQRIARVVLSGHVCMTGTGVLDHPPTR